MEKQARLGYVSQRGSRRQRAQQGCACSARAAGPGLGEGTQQQTQAAGPLKLSRHSFQQDASTPRQGTARCAGTRAASHSFGLRSLQ